MPRKVLIWPARWRSTARAPTTYCNCMQTKCCFTPGPRFKASLHKMSRLGLTRQFSWDEPSDGSPAGLSGASTSQAAGRGVVARELEEYVASVRALGDPAAELEYQALLTYSVQEHLAQLATPRGWLVQALRQPEQQLLNVTVGQISQSGSPASAELRQALEQVQQLDKALASLASRSAASPAPCASEGSDGCEGGGQGAALAFAALLAKEKEQQHHAWQLEIALAEDEQAATETSAIIGLHQEVDKPLVEIQLSMDDEEVIQRLLTSESEATSLDENAFDICYTPAAGRLAEINARLAELNPQKCGETSPNRQSVVGNVECSSGLVDDDSFQPGEMFLDDARESRRRAEEEASRRAKKLAVIDACLRRVRTGS